MDKCLLSLNNTGVIYSSASKYGLLLAVTTTVAASEVSAAASIKPFSESSVSRALAHSTTTLLLLPLCLCAAIYTELQIYIWLLPPEAPVTTDVVGRCSILLLLAAAAAVGIHVVCSILSLEAVGVEAAEVTVC